MQERQNIHATALAIGDRGILVTGASGSGKTTLALSLVAEAGRTSRFAALVCDDRVWLSVAGDRLLAHAPQEIAGLAEVRGLGPRPVHHLPGAVVDLVVRLVPPDEFVRLPEPSCAVVLGLSIPLLIAPERNAIAASIGVAAWLGSPPFRTAAVG